MYGIHEVVNHLTKSGVGCGSICSKEGGYQIVGPGPTGKVTSHTSRIGLTEVFPEWSFSVGMGGFDVSCALQLRWAATVLDLILFLGGCSSDDEGRDVGQVALLLDAFGFFSLTVTWGVEFDLLTVSSGALEGNFTSGWVGVADTTGGGENNHLSSLRNEWGKCRGVTGGVFSPSSKGSSDISGEGSTGRKGSPSLIRFILPVSLSNSNKSCEQSIM